MQITLVQTEIEDAIRQYVEKRARVHANERVDIDLKATRGDVGYQAFIDIVPEGSERRTNTSEAEEAAPAAKAEPKEVQSSISSTSTATVPVRRGRPPKDRTAEAANQSEPQNEPQDEPEVADAGPNETAPEMAEAQAEPATEEVAPTAPRTRLFGGLSRPRND